MAVEWLARRFIISLDKNTRVDSGLFEKYFHKLGEAK